VKAQNGGLNLFATKADYDANVPLTTASNGTTIFLVNQTRYTLLWEFVFAQYMDDPAQTLNNQMRTALRNAGVTDVALFSLAQYEPPIDNWARDQDARAFAVTKRIGATSQYLTWAQTTTA